MSPLWRDEVAILLSPRRLALVRRARGVRPRVVAATEVTIPTNASGEIGPVLARLADVLADPTWHGAAARAVVADQPWVRYAIVPWPSGRLDAAGRVAHARFVLEDAHGAVVAGWTVALEDAPPGRSFVACAVPAALRVPLDDVLAPARLSLASLRPQLVVAYEAWRHRLRSRDAWFVRVDESSIAAVHLLDGAWDRVHVARVSADWRLDLERLRAFDRATRSAESAGRMLVDAPPWMRGGPALGPGAEWLEEDEGAGSPDLALLRGSYP